MIEHMDDGEIEISDQVLLQRGRDESSGNFLGPTCGADSLLDELLKNTTTCTHTHMCNPPSPYAAVHTHTCYHTHMQVLASEEERDPNSEQCPPRAKRPSGNKEAVRKYREKKKAHTAYLEEEVQKLHVVNQQLLRKLQGQAILETEVVRLRSVLVDLRSKIDGELPSFPLQNLCNSPVVSRKGYCRMQPPGGTIQLTRLTELPCFLPSASSSYQDGILGDGKPMITLACKAYCEPPTMDGHVKTNGAMMVNLTEAPLQPSPSNYLPEQ